MRRPTIWRASATILMLSGLALMPAIAAQPEAELATLSPAGGSVMWEVRSSAPQMNLSVTGPGVSIRKVSEGGAGLGLSLTGDEGSPLPDGTYNWEIWESFPGVNDGVYDPANGRDGVDVASASARIDIEGRVQSGVFTIKNGFVVDSTLMEATAEGAGSSAEKEVQ